MSSRLRPLLHDLRWQLRRDGARAFARSLAERLRRALRNDEDYQVLLLDLDAIAQPAGNSDIALEPLTERHLPELYELNRKRGFMRADKRFARYLERGFGGYVGYRDGELVGYYWWVDRSAREPHPDLASLGLGIDLDEHDVYGSDFFLLEEHRGGGRAHHFLHDLERDLRDRGYRRIWGYVVTTNRPARWLYSARGYKPMWTVSHRTGLLNRGGETASVQGANTSG